MRTVWKYEVQGTKFSLDIPKDAELLDVQAQGDVAVMWFRVDSEAPKERRDFATAVTGGPTPDDAEGEDWWHLGTVQLFAGTFVVHLFERNIWGE